MKPKKDLCTLSPWASADFFPGEGKIFQGGGQKHTICPKNTKKDTIFVLKSQKHTILASQGGGQGPPLALPCGRPCTNIQYKMYGCLTP